MARSETPKFESEKNKAPNDDGNQEVANGIPPPPTRKISSDSVKSAPGHRRTPSSESQSKEFKTFLERQGFKGHRRSKSTEIRGKTYVVHHRTSTFDGQEKIYSSSRSTDGSLSGDAATVPQEPGFSQVNTTKAKRKLGFSGKSMLGNEEASQDKQTAPIDIIAKADSIKGSLEMASEAQEVVNGGAKTDQGKQGDGVVVPLVQRMEKVFPEPSRKSSSCNVAPGSAESPLTRVDSTPELVSGFETLSHQEILESQEYASPAAEDKHIQIPAKTADKTSPEASRSEVRWRDGDGSVVSPLSKSANVTTMLTPTLKDVHETWQDLERRRRTIQERLRKRMQYEDGERGELHPKLVERYIVI